MGLNYNYLLYFKRDRLWDVLHGLGDMCDSEGMTPTTIHFPDHDLEVPLMSNWGQGNEHAFDKPQYKFAISMTFDEDEAILDYLNSRDGDRYDRSPPDETGVRQVDIGFIYLTVYADLSKHYAFKDKPTDMVLFEFGTTGTQMSILFEASASIRKTFIKLLARYQGLIGILDLEIDYGQMFWFMGEEIEYTPGSNYMLPEEIEQEIIRGY
jgi:hypothetical protein